MMPTILCAFLSTGTLNMIEIEETVILLLGTFTGAGEGAVWEQTLGCFPPAGCGDERPNLLLGGGIFTSIVR